MEDENIMTKILFCKIAWMKYYKGNTAGDDVPVNGGSYVDKNNDGAEKYNFLPVRGANHVIGLPSGKYCYGFVEPGWKNPQEQKQIRLENIKDCETYRHSDKAEDVLVIYCATDPERDGGYCNVVGWYEHAGVFRRFIDDGKNYFNAVSASENCVLLPVNERRKEKWRVPSARGNAYGFGQSNVWYANPGRIDKLPHEELEQFLAEIQKQISAYKGDNWVLFTESELRRR